MAAVSLFLGGAFNAGFAVMQSTLVYRAAPAEMRARLLGLVSVCIGTAPIGFLYLGFLAEMFSPRTATIALAAQGVLVMLLDAAILGGRVAALRCPCGVIRDT